MTPIYKAAIYCRFSRDDREINDSSSINSQKMMLEKYCDDNNFEIYSFYVDDGFCGINFERPDFKRMLDDIDNKKVNLVIVKDLSRIGREYIQTGYYVEHYFSRNNIRFISINDGYDSLNGNSDFLPFKMIFNDFYSKDLSKKIKSAKKERAIKGIIIPSRVPYGYKKNPNNPIRFIID